MRILYLATRECWPLTTGARLRDYHLARELAARCSLTYVGLHDPGEPEGQQPPQDAGFAQNLSLVRERGFTASKVIRGLAGPMPVTVLNYFSPGVQVELAEILARGGFDTIQMEGVHLIGYLPIIRSAASRPAVLADWHNIESELMHRYSAGASSLLRRVAARRTAGLVRRAEDRLLAACDAHTVTSERERQQLSARAPDARILVVPNGVESGFYSGGEMARDREEHGSGRSAKPSIVFVGSMDYHGNIDAVLWFAREVWPHLRRKYPNLYFTIVGRSPSAEVKSLASEGVEVTGTVDDVRPFYGRALAAVVPLRIAGGTRLKILEAMAAGVPVVSTRVGAEGLEVEDEQCILLADTAGDMIAAIDRLVTSSATRQRLAEAGRSLVISKYDWSMLGAQIYDVHCELRAGQAGESETRRAARSSIHRSTRPPSFFFRAR